MKIHGVLWVDRSLPKKGAGNTPTVSGLAFLLPAKRLIWVLICLFRMRLETASRLLDGVGLGQQGNTLPTSSIPGDLLSGCSASNGSRSSFIGRRNQSADTVEINLPEYLRACRSDQLREVSPSQDCGLIAAPRARFWRTRWVPDFSGVEKPITGPEEGIHPLLPAQARPCRRARDRTCRWA